MFTYLLHGTVLRQLGLTTVRPSSTWRFQYTSTKLHRKCVKITCFGGFGCKTLWKRKRKEKKGGGGGGNVKVPKSSSSCITVFTRMVIENLLKNVHSLILSGLNWRNIFIIFLFIRNLLQLCAETFTERKKGKAEETLLLFCSSYFFFIFFLQQHCKTNICRTHYRESEVPWMEVAVEKSRSAILWDLQAWTYYNLY